MGTMGLFKKAKGSEGDGDKKFRALDGGGICNFQAGMQRKRKELVIS